jgi:hypothetical protein
VFSTKHALNRLIKTRRATIAKPSVRWVEVRASGAGADNFITVHHDGQFSDADLKQGGELWRGKVESGQSH